MIAVLGMRKLSNSEPAERRMMYAVLGNKGNRRATYICFQTLSGQN